jgi:hypothetical protein
MGMIRKLLPLLLIMGTLAFAEGRIYELRTYTSCDGQRDALKAGFRDHTSRIYKKHGIESVGYSVPQNGERPKNTLFYILVHPSREAAAKNWAEFQADPEWKKDAAENPKQTAKFVQPVESVWNLPGSPN